MVQFSQASIQYHIESVFPIEKYVYITYHLSGAISPWSSMLMKHIGSDFPDEFIHSQDTMAVRGPNAKAKANLVQGIIHLVQIARKTKEVENLKGKNSKKAKKDGTDI